MRQNAARSGEKEVTAERVGVLKFIGLLLQGRCIAAGIWRRRPLRVRGQGSLNDRLPNETRHAR